MSDVVPIRRFRFTLRTMLLCVAIFALPLGFAFNWIHQRHAFRNEAEGVGGIGDFALDDNSISAYRRWAPFPLFLFGERGVPSIHFRLFLGDSDHHLTATELAMRPASPKDEATIARAKRLFPEADISRSGYVRVIVPTDTP